MDTTASEIVFDEKGVCNFCKECESYLNKTIFRSIDIRTEELNVSIDNVKALGKNDKYDCLIGLSGGVDSSYICYWAKQIGLRPLIIHFDNGWNSELAVKNIENIIQKTGFDLYTYVIDWEGFKDLQLAYLKSGVANQDVVQDHAFFASLYHFAVQHNIKYVISGNNISTESVLPKAWHHAAMDAINLKSIHRLFGKRKLSEYKTISFFEYFFYYPFIKGMEVVCPLNFMPYNKDEALKFLKEKINYKEYGRKHGESRFTKFFQNYVVA